MSKITYAFIKNNIVLNSLVFEDPSNEMLEEFKLHEGADEVVVATSSTEIGGTWDGVKFTRKKPFDSWILDENNEWQPPIPMPDKENIYKWNEDMLQWEAVVL